MAIECTEQFRSPQPGSVSAYYGVYVFPVLFFIGVCGNVLNLAVFNSRGMRSKANCFLSSMAVADIGFFLTMFMFYTSLYDFLWYSKYFVAFYYYAKSSITFFSNWFSSSSIWFAVMVTVERLIAIRFPLKIRLLLTRRRIAFIIVFIVVAAFVLQLYHFFWYTVIKIPSCSNPNQTVYALRGVTINISYHGFMYYRTSVQLTAIVIVFVPLLIMAVLNGLIVHFLWQNRTTVARLANGNEINRQNSSSVKERKVTIMVLIIVTAFLACNLPSAVCNIINLFRRDLTCLAWSNYLVCVNKALNFILYCCVSKGFRKKCKILFVRLFYDRLCRCGRAVQTAEEKDEENGLLTTQSVVIGTGNGPMYNGSNQDRQQHQETSKLLNKTKNLDKSTEEGNE